MAILGRGKAEVGESQVASRDLRASSCVLSRRLSDGRARRCVASRLSHVSSASQLATRTSRRGISLMEVLISMFVLLFGLMGVAAIFPVGNYYAVEGEKHDLGQLIAQNAFEEIQARGMLRPELWLYANGRPNGTVGSATVPTETGGTELIQPPGATSPGWFNIVPGVGPDPGSGHAWVIDPMSSASAISGTAHLDLWPLLPASKAINIWFGMGVEGNRWPVRRITLPIPDPNTGGSQPLTPSVAETIFRLRDDLAVEMPERDDAPSIQRWNTADIDNTGNANNTPNDPNDDTLLSRQYHGNFSWLVTIVPPTEQAHESMQPALRQRYPYEVSVVVFYKRVPTPAPETERLLQAEMLPGGELVMYGGTIEEVDKSLEGIKSGDWVAVMGVNETSGAFMLKWYRLLALDEETDTQVNHGYTIKSNPVSNLVLRRAMLLGPDWHFPPGANEVRNLRVAILPGVASVVTREMVLEQDSLWSGN